MQGQPNARPRPAQGKANARPRPGQGKAKASPRPAQGQPKARPMPAQGQPKARPMQGQCKAKARPRQGQGRAYLGASSSAVMGCKEQVGAIVLCPYPMPKARAWSGGLHSEAVPDVHLKRQGIRQCIKKRDINFVVVPGWCHLRQAGGRQWDRGSECQGEEQNGRRQGHG